MKIYVLISLILFTGIGCRSSRNTVDTYVRAEQTGTKKEIQEESIHQEKQYLETEKKETNTRIDEEITLVTYDPASGNVQSVQTTRRTTGRNELADGSRQRSENTQLGKTTNTDIQSETKIESDMHQESTGDSRPVQGWKEWGVIALVGGIVVLIIGLIKRNRR